MTSALCIGAIFFLQTSWFVAWMTLDQRRIESQRDSLLPCIVHRDWKSPSWSEKDYGKIMMGKLASLLQRKHIQAVVFLVTATLFGAGLYGVTHVSVDFNIDLLVPANSYIR